MITKQLAFINKITKQANTTQQAQSFKNVTPQHIMKLIMAFRRRKATKQQLIDLFDSNTIKIILSKVFNGNKEHRQLASERGKFVEFLRQEYLQKCSKYDLYDKYHKIMPQDFSYAGGDIADIRAVHIDESNPDNVDILCESGKFLSQQKSGGISKLDLAQHLVEGQRLKLYLDKPDARLTLSVIGNNGGFSNDAQAWRSANQQDIHDMKWYGPTEIEQWFKSVALLYERNEWSQHFSSTSSPIAPYYHQERLCARWSQQMLYQHIRLMMAWACRTGKTYGGLLLIKKWIEEYNKLNGTDLKIKVAVVCYLPTLFEDWEKSIKDVFDTSAVIHKHNSKTKPQDDSDKHLFVLSSAQMLGCELQTQEEKDNKIEPIDKKINKEVMFKDEFDVLIYDEGHLGLLAEKTYKQVIKKIKHKHLIGMTATPYRPGLLDDSIFNSRDTFGYFEQLVLKRDGHPDYQDMPERHLISLVVTTQTKKLFKDLELTELGKNIKSIYTDPHHMKAMLAMLSHNVFDAPFILNNPKHRVKDILIRVDSSFDSVSPIKVLTEALENYQHPMTGEKLSDKFIIGAVSGGYSSLPGVTDSGTGVGAGDFKKKVDAFFEQQPSKRKILVVIGQGSTGHTFKTLNTFINLSSISALSEIAQTQDRPGSKYTYQDGYVKDNYYCFDPNEDRIISIAEQLRTVDQSDKKKIYSDVSFTELLNLWQDKNGVELEQVNEDQYKRKLDEFIGKQKLKEILPSPSDIIINDKHLSEYDCSKLKNGFGNVSFEDENDNDNNPNTPKKKSPVNRTLINRTENKKDPKRKLDKNTQNIIERVINILPMVAGLIEINDARSNQINNVNKKYKWDKELKNYWKEVSSGVNIEEFNDNPDMLISLVKQTLTDENETTEFVLQDVFERVIDKLAKADQNNRTDLISDIIQKVAEANDKKKSHSEVFTSRQGAKQLLKKALIKNPKPFYNMNSKFAEPSFGSGNVIVALVELLMTTLRSPTAGLEQYEKLKKWSDDDLRTYILDNMIYGVELQAHLIPFTLYVLDREGKCKKLVNHLNQGDALNKESWVFDGKDMWGQFDCVLGNPPYNVLEGSARNSCDYAYESWANNRESKALYLFFMRLAYDLLKPEGIVIYVTRATMLTGEVVSKFREDVLKQDFDINLVWIPQAGSLFSNAQTTGMGLMCSKKSKEQPRTDTEFVRYINDQEHSCTYKIKDNDIKIPLLWDKYTIDIWEKLSNLGNKMITAKGIASSLVKEHGAYDIVSGVLKNGPKKMKTDKVRQSQKYRLNNTDPKVLVSSGCTDALGEKANWFEGYFDDKTGQFEYTENVIGIEIPQGDVTQDIINILENPISIIYGSLFRVDRNTSAAHYRMFSYDINTINFKKEIVEWAKQQTT